MLLCGPFLFYFWAELGRRKFRQDGACGTLRGFMAGWTCMVLSHTYKFFSWMESLGEPVAKFRDANEELKARKKRRRGMSYLGVHARWQGRGVGSELLNGSIEEMVAEKDAQAPDRPTGQRRRHGTT